MARIFHHSDYISKSKQSKFSESVCHYLLHFIVGKSDRHVPKSFLLASDFTIDGINLLLNEVIRGFCLYEL